MTYFDDIRLILAVQWLSPAAKLVFIYLYDRQGGNGHSWPSIATISRDCGGLARSTVVQSLQAIEKAGLLAIERPGKPSINQSNRYSINLTSLKIEPVEPPNQSENQTSTGMKIIPVEPNQSEIHTRTGTKFEPELVRNSDPNVSSTESINESEDIDLFGQAEPKEEITPEGFLEHWNTFDRLPTVRAFSKERRDKLAARAKEQTFKTHWREIVRKLAGSAFHTGNNDRGWRASVDWILKNDTNYLKILELPDPMDGVTREADESEIDLLLGVASDE